MFSFVYINVFLFALAALFAAIGFFITLKGKRGGVVYFGLSSSLIVFSTSNYLFNIL
jgi:hypothetical protein